MRAKPVLAVAAILGFVAFSLAACGDDDESATPTPLETATAQTTPTAGPTPEPTPDDEAVREFEQFVVAEAAQLDFWLRIAAGEDVPCPEPCVRDDDPVTVIGRLLSMCGKLAPEGLREARGYRAELHSDLVNALITACHILNEARDALGEPADTPSWRMAAQEAHEVLGPLIAVDLE